MTESFPGFALYCGKFWEMLPSLATFPFFRFAPVLLHRVRGTFSSSQAFVCAVPPT